MGRASVLCTDWRLRFPDPSMNLYVSNLAYSVTDEELRSEFSAYGNVSSARVVMDRETGRSRGFGFVEMPTDAEAQAALKGLEGSNLAGRPLKIVEARPKEDRPRPAGGGGGALGGFKKGGPGPGQGGGRSGGNDRGGGGRDYGNDWGDRDRGGKREKPRDRGGKRGGGGYEDDWG